LVQSGAVDALDMISHRFPIEQTPDVFALNAAYEDEIVKVVIDV
jgi:L-iditol 2-dehydrogenase